LTEFVHAVRDRFEDAARMGEMPVLVTSAGSPPLRAEHHRALPAAETPVLS
jgi:flagellar biosynthesis protein FlhA